MNGVTKLEEWIHFLLGIGCLLTSGTIFVSALLAFASPETKPLDYTAVISIIFAIYACLYSGFANLSKAGV